MICGLSEFVMPAQAGIQRLGALPRLDSRFRGNDSSYCGDRRVTE